MGKKINLTTIKSVSSLAVAILVTLVAASSSLSVLRKITIDTTRNFYESSKNTLDGYHQSIKFCLELYKNSLDMFYDEENFPTASSEEIYSHLLAYQKLKNPDFYNVFFVDKENNFFFSTGRKSKNTEFEYITFLSNKDTNYHLTDTLPNEQTQIFLITRKVFDDKAKVKGLLCATIRLETLMKLLKNINFKEEDPIVLIDSQGRFIFHPDSNQIYKKFVPKSEKYKQQTSELVATMKDGIIETESTDARPIDLLFTKIDKTNWTLGYRIPKSITQVYFKGIISSVSSIFIISVLTIFILVILETIIFNIFHKKQLITVNYDSITNLWTRQKFEIEATKMLNHNKKAKFMLIECDIRNFKFINQNYGVKQADKLIRFYSKQLNKITNEMHGIIGRGFADHFYILTKISSVNNAMSIFKKQNELVLESIKKYDIPFFPK